MDIFYEIKTIKAFLNQKKKAGCEIGYVPTMGALHQGHISLIDSSKNKNLFTACSIFVNPAQFNNPNDLLRYPQSLDADIEQLRNANCDVLFCPSAEEMYASKSSVSFDFGSLTNTMEGFYRPGHFSGVALVVCKLFNIIEPDHAFFGQKDWQQYRVVSQLINDLNFDVRLHSVSTVREYDGLALSSRNQRLSIAQRKKATIFYQMLIAGKEQLEQGYSIDIVRDLLLKRIDGYEELKIEYFELADRENLSFQKTVTVPNRSVLCIAGYVGEVRLIDNVLL